MNKVNPFQRGSAGALIWEKIARAQTPTADIYKRAGDSRMPATPSMGWFRKLRSQPVKRVPASLRGGRRTARTCARNRGTCFSPKKARRLAQQTERHEAEPEQRKAAE